MSVIRATISCKRECEPQLYLLDTNIYIDFYDRFYPKEHFPSFWKQITPIIDSQVVIPDVVVNENYQDDWFTKDFLANNYHHDFLKHRDHLQTWAQILKYIDDSPYYSSDALTNNRSWAHERIADGWIIAIAKDEGYTIVTHETSNPNLNKLNKSKNPKIPDVATDFDVRCINMLDFFNEIELKV